MYLLDTDIIVWISRDRKDVLEAVQKTAKTDFVGVTTISIAEIYAGIRPTEVSLVENFFDQQEVLPITREIATQGGYYWQAYVKKFQKLSLADCLVAATAKLNNAVILTLNTRHYPMPDIKIFNPLKNKATFAY